VVVFARDDRYRLFHHLRENPEIEFRKLLIAGTLEKKSFGDYFGGPN
jgi:hypothetical protein